MGSDYRDEAHEGTPTELGKAVMKELTKEQTKVLRLSGAHGKIATY